MVKEQSAERRYIERNGLPVRELLNLALREGNSKAPVYRMHKWWARRLGSVVRAVLLGLLLPEDTTEREYWDIYSGIHPHSEPEDRDKYTVLDPFMGGGSSLVEAFRLNLNCIGFDIDPMAWFITRQELSIADLKALEMAFEQVRRNAQPKVARFYKTETECGEQRDVIYYFWVRTVTCPYCGETVELHPHYQLQRNGKEHIQTCFCLKCHEIHELPASRQVFTCKSCGTLTTISKGSISRTNVHCLHCGANWPRTRLREEQAFGEPKLFALQYLEPGKHRNPLKVFKKASQSDLTLFQVAEREFSVVIETFPAIQSLLNTAIPLEGREDRRPINYGFHHYAELFNARQLLCLTNILKAILDIQDNSLQELLLLAFSDSLASNNMMCYYAFDYDKLTPLFGMHGYNMVTRPVENNVWGTSLGRGSFKNCFTKVLKGLSYMRNSGFSQSGVIVKRNGSDGVEMNSSGSDAAILHKLSAVDLHRVSADQTMLSDNSIDVILTDPPYFDNLNYGEMSDFFYAWLRPFLNQRYPEEFKPINCVGITDHIHGNADPQSLLHFRNGLTKVFSECKRVLKDSGIMALTFHHRRDEPWLALSEALAQAGFTIVQVVPVRSEGRSGFHSAPGNLMWDAVLVCRPSISNVRIHPKEGLDVEYTLKEWKEDLMELEGSPSEDDWRSLESAIKCMARHITLMNNENVGVIQWQESHQKV
jgi:putative DNA methylase